MLTSTTTTCDLIAVIGRGEASATEVVAEHLELPHRVHEQTDTVAAFEDARAMNDAALDPARSVGGSSSGEAVVVATGASPLGIGSDSGGSIRLPAAWCRVLGLNPTAGRVPTTGHFPRIGALRDGRTQIGPLARSVDDLELALSVMAGPDGRDAGVAPVPLLPSSRVELRGVRIGVIVGEPDWAPAPAPATAVEAVDLLLTPTTLLAAPRVVGRP